VKLRMSVNAVLMAAVISGVGTNIAAANGLTASDVARVSGIEDSVFYPIVRGNALYHSEGIVRASAWQALRWADGDAALLGWIRTGLPEAKRLASQNNARNKDFAERVVKYYPAQSSPRVNAKAKLVLTLGDADREHFARIGFAEAKALDDAAREADEQHKQQILEADREFVRTLAQTDPGEQVRVAARHALRFGGQDTDHRAFFASEWMAAAASDVDLHRTRSLEAGAWLHAAVAQLLVDAKEAEREALAAEGAAAEQARAVAARAWATTKEKADEARRAWEDEAAACADQARYWRTVIERALASSDPVWAAIATKADKNLGLWTGEGSFADGQTRHWADVEKQAQDGHDRMTAPA
jgi:hypothetical protein